jgi:hypothetical protein
MDRMCWGTATNRKWSFEGQNSQYQFCVWWDEPGKAAVVKVESAYAIAPVTAQVSMQEVVVHGPCRSFGALRDLMWSVV